MGLGRLIVAFFAFTFSAFAQGPDWATQVRNKPVFDVLDQTYGAKCDATTNDAVAIQAANDAAEAAGGTVLFPNATCRVGATVVINSPGVEWVGRGSLTELRMSDSVDLERIVQVTGTSDVAFRSIRFDGNREAQSAGAGQCIQILNSTRVTVDSSRFEFCGRTLTDTAIRGQDSSNVSITNSFFGSNFGHDIGVQDFADNKATSGWRIIGNQFGSSEVTDANTATNHLDTQGAGAISLSVSGLVESTVANNVFNGSRRDADGTTTRYALISFTDADQITFTGNVVTGMSNAYSTIDVTNGSGTIDCTDAQCFFSTIADTSWETDVGTFMTIEGDSTLYQVTAVASATQLTVTPVVARANGTALRYRMNYSADLFGLDGTNSTITGNSFSYSHEYGAGISGGNGESFGHTITGNVAEYNCKSGFSIWAANHNLYDISITGNIARNNGQCTGAGILCRSGICLRAGAANTIRYVNIQGNFVGDDQASPTQLFGIGAENDAQVDDNWIANNIADGNVTAAIDAGISRATNAVVTNNAQEIGFGDNVGVGIADPGARLNVYDDNASTASLVRIENDGPGDASLALFETGVNGWIMGLNNDLTNALQFGTDATDVGGSPVMTMERTGDVGIGVTVPLQPLAVNGGIQALDAGAKPTCDSTLDGTIYNDSTTKEICHDDGTPAWEDLIAGAGAANNFGVIGNATADVGNDTLTVTDSATIDFTTTNDPEDLTGIVIAESIGTAQIDETAAYVFSQLAATTLTGGNLTLNDGVGDSPQATFTPQTGTSWSLYVNDTTDDLQAEVNTGATESFDLVNAGAGVVDFSVDGAITEAGNAVPNVTNNLSVFASTTSLQLAGVLSDETGTGLFVLGTSPTIVTPTIASFVNATHDHLAAAGGGTLTAAALSDQHAGTDITTDLEEESHASEHTAGGADIITVDGVDAGAATTRSNENPIQIASHDTDCTSLTDGVRGELCIEEDSENLYSCQPTAGGCDTAGEWILTGDGSGGAPPTDSVGTAELDDGTDTPLAGEWVQVDPSDTTQFNYRTDAELLSDAGAEPASAYSGIGTCTNQFAQVLNDDAAPTCASVDQANDVTGILGVANGGTGTSTAFTLGSVVFAGASGVYTQNNTGLFFETGTGELGLGTATPATILNIYENNAGTSAGLRVENDGTGDAAFLAAFTGVGGWTFGLDNDDADAFKFSTNTTDVGTNTRVTFTTAGHVGIGAGAVGSPDELFHAAEAVDGSAILALLENSTAADAGTNETAELRFGFGTNNDVARIVARKEGDYQTGAAEDSSLDFYTDASATATLALRLNSAQEVEEATIDAAGTNNDIIVPHEIKFWFASCIGGTASLQLDDSGDGATAPTAACNDTGNIQRPSADFAGGAVNSQELTIPLPSDWNSTKGVSVDVRYVITAASPTGNVELDLSTVCRAVGETWDGTFNTIQTTTEAVAAQNTIDEASQASLTTTGCAADEDLTLRISRDGVNDSNNDAAKFLTGNITLWRTM